MGPRGRILFPVHLFFSALQLATERGLVCLVPSVGCNVLLEDGQSGWQARHTHSPSHRSPFRTKLEGKDMGVKKVAEPSQPASSVETNMHTASGRVSAAIWEQPPGSGVGVATGPSLPSSLRRGGQPSLCPSRHAALRRERMPPLEW